MHPLGGPQGGNIGTVVLNYDNMFNKNPEVSAITVFILEDFANKCLFSLSMLGLILLPLKLIGNFPLIVVGVVLGCYLESVT